MSAQLTVSLAALLANYRAICSQARGQVAAVVKADAYGLGALSVSRALLSAGADSLFVATLLEGTRLRRSLADEGLKATIYVLEGLLEQAPTQQVVDEFVRHELTPVLNTEAQLVQWSSCSEPCAVHVDTGMQRLGLDWQSAAQTISQTGIVPKLLMSHLARGDEPGHAFTQCQLQRAHGVFNQLNSTVAEPSDLSLSLCNSAGLLSGVGPEDLGRAGIALYGGNPFNSGLAREHGLRAVVSVLAPVLQVREVPAETPLGYGGAFVTWRTSRIAVLGCGYADGLPRLLSNLGQAAFTTGVAPIVGRVSMDMVQVDVTELSELPRFGDFAELLGENISLDEVAQQAQTIAYEILTGLDASRRLQRIVAEG